MRMNLAVSTKYSLILFFCLVPVSNLELSESAMDLIMSKFDDLTDTVSDLTTRFSSMNSVKNVSLSIQLANKVPLASEMCDNLKFSHEVLGFQIVAFLN